MQDDFKVHVIDYGRKFLYMRYTDPLTGKHVARSTKTNKKSEANRVAAKWESELQEGRYKSPLKVTWQEFTDRYEAEVLPSLAKSTSWKVWAAFSSIEEAINPKRMADLTAEQLSIWQKHLRDKGLAESTIKGHCAHLKAALNWSKDVAGMLHEVPVIRMPQRAKASKVMKGRAITAEEFERMLEKVPAIVGTERAASWRYLLTGLWWSGLRISEAVELTWDGNDLRVEKSDNYYILRIPAESQKSNEEQVLPIAPEFNKMLREVPLDQQTGFVFNVPTRRGETRRVDTVSKIICKIGEAAMIKVSSSKRNGKTVLKWASAHDLRRAFGTRWAALISPNDLQTLMRHSDFKTTQKFYITQDARSLTDRLQAAVGDLGNTLGNTNAKPPETKKPSSTQSVSMKDVSKLPE